MKITILLLALLWPVSALAQSGEANDWTLCAGETSRRVSTNVTGKEGGNRLLCFEFDETWTTAATSGFTVVDRADVCFNPNVNGTIGAARIMIQRCVGGVCGAGTVIDTQDAVWDGTGGAAGTQNACDGYGPGVYRIDVRTAVTAGQDAKVEIRGKK